MARRLVLVVDDHTDIQVIFSTVLIHHGFAGLVADNGREAVEQARLHGPDVILMDLDIPVVTGWEANRLLRIDGRTASIPVLAVTARDELEQPLQEEGFRGLLTKPVRPADVVQAVENCLTATASRRVWTRFRPGDVPSGALG